MFSNFYGANQYGYGFNNYIPQPQQPTPQQTQYGGTNTNKIFVSGLEEVKNKQLPPNSDFIFLDNYKPLLYQKIVDGKGQFEIKQFDITVKKEPVCEVNGELNTLSKEEFTSQIDHIKGEIEGIKEELSKIKDKGSDKDE